MRLLPVINAVLILALLTIAGCTTAPAVKQGYMFAGSRYVDTKAGPIMVMIGKNNLEIAALIARWLAANVR